MESPPDVERLRALFQSPGFHWIMDRLAERMSRGRPLTGLIVHAQATSEERRALDDFLGRRSTVGDRLSLRLDELQRTLDAAGLAACLADAVLVCRGPIENQRAAAERRRDEWDALFNESIAPCAAKPLLSGWVEALFRDGTLKRISRGDVAVAARLMSGAWQVISRVPDSQVLLANLAAECAGDSHALDRGQPLATLCLRAIAVLHGIDGQGGASARRQAWAALGVIIDDLSSPVLTFNLRGTAGSGLGQLLQLYREQAQPAFLTYRQLQDANAFVPLEPALRRVFVCENPSVISAAARELGSHCHPLVCTNGQPNSAVHLLLSQLRAAGAELWCHADLDWAGLGIVDQLVREHGAMPWRMGVEDYQAASAAVPLEPQPCSARWSPNLADAIRARGSAVFEEQVISTLLEDLRVGQGGWSDSGM